MKKTITISLMLVLLIAGLVIAQPGGGRGGCDAKHGGNRHDGMPMLLKMADKLALTDAQTEQIEAMSIDFRLEKIDLQAEIKKEQVMMNSLMRDDDASEKAVFAKIDKLAQLKAEKKKMHYSHKTAVQSILTDEQTAKLKELRKNRGPKGQRGGDCDQSNFEGRRGDGQGHKGNFRKN